MFMTFHQRAILNNTMNWTNYRISHLSKSWDHKGELMQPKEWGISCLLALFAVMSHISCTWNGTASLSHSPTGLWCWPLSPYFAVFQLQGIQSTLARMHYKPQIQQFICKQDIIYFILWQSCATSLFAHSTGSCSEKSNNKFMVLMRISDGEDLCT